jgi:hypothetical protein
MLDAGADAYLRKAAPASELLRCILDPERSERPGEPAM